MIDNMKFYKHIEKQHHKQRLTYVPKVSFWFQRNLQCLVYFYISLDICNVNNVFILLIFVLILHFLILSGYRYPYIAKNRVCPKTYCYVCATS